MDPKKWVVSEAPKHVANNLIVDVLTYGLNDWALPSAAAFRNTVLAYERRGPGDFAGMMVNPILDITEAKQIEFIVTQMATCIRNGAMIDFGFIPNEIIKRDSTRFRPDFEAGELAHPYPVWLAISRWEGGLCGYFIITVKDDGSEAVVVETYGVRVPERQHVPAHDSIVINDIISIKVNGIDDTDVVPFPSREGMSVEHMQMRGANALDPLVTMLAMLANAGIPISHIAAPEKLNKARVKQGKAPIPPHTVVETAGYVTVVTRDAAVARLKAHQGGTHASPIAHSRRGHERRLASGVVIPVRATRVNWREAAEVKRMFYQIKERP